MAVLSPRLTQFPAIADSIASLQSRFRELGAIDTVQLLAGQVFKPVQSELVRRTLVYHLSGARGDLIAQVQLLEEFGEHYIDALQIQPITPAMRTQNAFWHNLGVAQFVMLVCTLGAVVFTLWAAVTVARTPMRRRWLWVFVALLGVTKISMNWTTGAVSTKLLSVQLLSASAGMSGPFAPWFVSLSFPAGALLALQQRKRALERLAARESPVPPPLSPEPSSSAV
jgi:hypothetical protein